MNRYNLSVDAEISIQDLAHAARAIGCRVGTDRSGGLTLWRGGAVEASPKSTRQKRPDLDNSADFAWLDIPSFLRPQSE